MDEVSSGQNVSESAREPLDTAVVVETPEHVRFRYFVAGPARRMAAYVIDTFLRGVILFVIGLLAILSGADAKKVSGGFATGLALIVAFLLEWGYFVAFETMSNGQSPGKRALALRVVNAAGRPLGFVDSALRNLLRAADYLPGAYCLGFAVMVGDVRFRRIGDFVAGTLVIAEDRASLDAELPEVAPPTPEETMAVPAHVRLSQRELEVVEFFLRRRPKLGPGRSAELAEMAARPIAARESVVYPDPVRFLEILYSRSHGGPRGA
jgi:uncharacterized RDD family membrane protein YckC